MKQTIWLNSIYLIIDTLLVKSKMIPWVYIESMVCCWSRLWRMRICGTKLWNKSGKRLKHLTFSCLKFPQLIAHRSDQHAYESLMFATHWSRLLSCSNTVFGRSTAVRNSTLLRSGWCCCAKHCSKKHDSFGWSCSLTSKEGAGWKITQIQEEWKHMQNVHLKPFNHWWIMFWSNTVGEVIFTYASFVVINPTQPRSTCTGVFNCLRRKIAELAMSWGAS